MPGCLYQWHLQASYNKGTVATCSLAGNLLVITSWPIMSNTQCWNAFTTGVQANIACRWATTCESLFFSMSRLYDWSLNRWLMIFPPKIHLNSRSTRLLIDFTFLIGTSRKNIKTSPFNKYLVWQCYAADAAQFDSWLRVRCRYSYSERPFGT